MITDSFNKTYLFRNYAKKRFCNKNIKLLVLVM